MAFQQRAPRGVSQPRCQLRRANDVGEQDRCEHALSGGSTREAGNEARGRGHRRLVGSVVDPRVHTLEGRKLGNLGTPDPRPGVVAWTRE